VIKIAKLLDREARNEENGRLYLSPRAGSLILQLVNQLPSICLSFSNINSDNDRQQTRRIEETTRKSSVFFFKNVRPASFQRFHIDDLSRHLATRYLSNDSPAERKRLVALEPVEP